MRNKENITQYLTRIGMTKADTETLAGALSNSNTFAKALIQYFTKEYAAALHTVAKNSTDDEILQAANTARTIRKLASNLDIKISLDIKTEIE